MGTVRETPPLPIEAHLIVLDDGTNILVDTGPTRAMIGDATAAFAVSAEYNVVARLASVGLMPPDIDQVVRTHFEPDHCGAHEEFPHAEFVVQRRHLVEGQTSGTCGTSGCARTGSSRARNWS